MNKQTIVFPNNNAAIAVFPSANDKAEDIVSALDLRSYKAVMLIIGGAGNMDEKLVPRLTQLFGRGIARAAADASAVIIDGGTKAGVMAIMGEGVAGRGYKSQLIGLAPAGKVTYPGAPPPSAGEDRGTPLEPNHSHFVLVEGNEWGDETAEMFDLVRVLGTKIQGEMANDPKSIQSQAKAAVKVPTLAILAGGGPVTRNEVLRAVRQNLTVIVIEGSGGVADEISTAWQNKDNVPDDPVMAEIISDGQLHFHQLSNPVTGIERLIKRKLGVDNVLMQAWETFAEYDLNANLQQKTFNRLQFSIIVIGVAGTALAIIQQVFRAKDANGDLPIPQFKGNMIWWLVYHLLIVTPILLAVLVTAVNRFKQGSKWLLLRAGAESIKREIYRYRTRAMYYKENPEPQLAEKVEDITRRTMRTEVNTSALKSYNKDNGFPPYMYAAEGGDDGFSHLTPDRYIEVRLGDQLSYFKKSALKLEKQLTALYWATFIIGGIGTYLAAVNQQVWIAVTTAIVAAMGTYLGYRQTENTLMKYNQAVTDLANVKAWWNALSAKEQAEQKNIDSLVEHTESTLEAELGGWVQQMQNALAELRKNQTATSEREENREPGEHPTSSASGENNDQDDTKRKQATTTPANEQATGTAARGNDQEQMPGNGEELKRSAGKVEIIEQPGTNVMNDGGKEAEPDTQGNITRKISQVSENQDQ